MADVILYSSFLDKSFMCSCQVLGLSRHAECITRFSSNVKNMHVRLISFRNDYALVLAMVKQQFIDAPGTYSLEQSFIISGIL